MIMEFFVCRIPVLLFFENTVSPYLCISIPVLCNIVERYIPLGFFQIWIWIKKMKKNQ
jgi:hypothetical protein